MSKPLGLVFSIIYSSIIGITFSFAEEVDVQDVSKQLKQAKSEYVKTENRHRKILGALYSINTEIKRISEKRSKARGQLLAAQSKVKYLSRDIALLKAKLFEQKIWLGRRLKSMYKFNNLGALRVFLSGSFRGNIDRNMKYMKSITDKDFQLISTYHENLDELKAGKEKLKKNVQQLLVNQNRMRFIEEKLEKNQLSKTKILRSIRASRKYFKNNLESLRAQAFELKISESEFADLLNVDFYINKGRMTWPVVAPVSRRFGLENDFEYKFKIYNKGLVFRLAQKESVKSIFGGHVEFAGSLGTVGKTVVINHGDNYFSVYSGFDTLEVAEGDHLERGEALGSAGIKSSKFYFEIRHYSDAVDPEVWLDRKLLVKTKPMRTAS